MRKPQLPFEEWRLEFARIMRAAVPAGPPEWDWTETMDWQEMREMFYDAGFSAEEAAAEELYAMANS